MIRKYARDEYDRHLCPICQQPIANWNISKHVRVCQGTMHSPRAMTGNNFYRISAARELAALIRSAGYGPSARRV